MRDVYQQEMIVLVLVNLNDLQYVGLYESVANKLSQ